MHPNPPRSVKENTKRQKTKDDSLFLKAVSCISNIFLSIAILERVKISGQ
tara:strand:+ start:155 stop:304 length:150 start_codon:yes stop_codon:yes gene_type:complete